MLLPVPAVLAQAWAPAAGQGSVTIAVQAIDNTGHVLGDGSTDPSGKSHNAAIYVEVDYAITDRLAVSVGVPYVFARFIGPQAPQVPLQPVDACHCWQSGWQDFGFAARYNLLNDATALTSSVTYGLPSHAYGYVGEAVVGRRLQELRIAVDAGRRLDAISPRLAVQGRYAYAFVQQVFDVPNNRSNATAELIFRVTDAITVQGSVFRQVTHGGLRVSEITTLDLLREHDRLMRDDYWHAGAGATFGLPRADVFLSYVEFVGGSHTHAGRAFTLGLSVPFER